MSPKSLITHIKEVAKCPSFSTYEERLHPYICEIFQDITTSEEVSVAGNNLIFQIGNDPEQPTVAIAAHLDKINHYGESHPDTLPVSVTDRYIEGAMDDSAGVGLLLALAEAFDNESHGGPNLLFFLSEMEESKGLREHPERLKNEGEGYKHGMGARRIAQACLTTEHIPDVVITLDTTPLFKGKRGLALYAKHWELNDLKASESLKSATSNVVKAFQAIDEEIELHNNTNDYLHYGYEFNEKGSHDVVSVALEPSIYPYHQQGEKVFVADIRQVYQNVLRFLKTY
ncbi:M28 family peptidase [Fodinibius salsisoli]|uniref:M28 family peptidase n=1 Tax=Fodinibius salsisoli TaxID=2820877 RepID=A0ABT3PJS3_9BACT|nr:M28 family peptidase [Fodinibius salsisoli]MCW9706203.1 M28 family peptidase [Fodinibius salsisoli]